MQWILWLGQIAGGVFGVISVFGLVVGGFLLLLKALAGPDELDQERGLN